jgi:hypothetical protein
MEKNMVKHLTSDLGCPWCGNTSICVTEDPNDPELMTTSCTWCGSFGPAVHEALPGYSLAGTAMIAYDTRKTWEETHNELKKG